MPDSFFHTKTRKRKRIDDSSTSKTKKGRKRPQLPKKTPQRDEELSDETQSDNAIEDLDLEHLPESDEPVLSDGEDENETPAQKRLRLAKLYLDGLKENLGEGEFDAAEIDKEILNSRLQRDVLEREGRVYNYIADSLAASFRTGEPSTSTSPKVRLNGHRLPVTHAICSSDGRWVYTASKDGSIIKWNLNTCRKAAMVSKVRPPKQINSKKGKKRHLSTNEDVDGHTDEILALALSDDGRYLASGGRDQRVGVWDVQGNGIKWVKGFRGHRDTISSLTFRKNSHQLYTASYDRSIKLFDLSPAVMGYVETLFGHQDSIGCVNALLRETAVSCGGRDKSVRFWKVVEESQLVFRGGGKSRLREVLEGGAEEDEDNGEEAINKEMRAGEKNFVEGSIDCVAMVDESTFVSGGDSGTIALWITSKKKPVYTLPVAHGLQKHHSETEGIVATPRWITSLACLPYSDLLASGSWEGQIRLWKLDLNPRERRISALGALEAPGVVNSLQITSMPTGLDANWAKSGRVMCVAGTGGELRDGRWMRVVASCGGFVYVI